MRKKVVVNKTQKGGNKKTKSMMDPMRSQKLGLRQPIKTGGRIGRSLGGGTGLKDIPAGKKFNGLRELPTKVRNQMKFKKNGGKV